MLLAVVDFTAVCIDQASLCLVFCLQRYLTIFLQLGYLLCVQDVAGFVTVLNTFFAADDSRIGGLRSDSWLFWLIIAELLLLRNSGSRSL